MIHHKGMGGGEDGGGEEGGGKRGGEEGERSKRTQSYLHLHTSKTFTMLHAYELCDLVSAAKRVCQMAVCSDTYHMASAQLLSQLTHWFDQLR